MSSSVMLSKWLTGLACQKKNSKRKKIQGFKDIKNIKPWHSNILDYCYCSCLLITANIVVGFNIFIGLIVHSLEIPLHYLNFFFVNHFFHFTHIIYLSVFFFFFFLITASLFKMSQDTVGFQCELFFPRLDNLTQSFSGWS